MKQTLINIIVPITVLLWAIKDSYNKAKQDTINYLEEVIKKL